MADPLRAVDGPSADFQGAAAVVDFGPVDGAVLQACRHCEYLRSGTRLVGVADTEVAPEQVPCLKALLVRHRSLLLRREVGVQISGIVQIEPVVRRHAEDFAVLRVHDNNAGIVSAHLRLKGRDVTLNDALYPDVDGGDHRVAVRRRLDDALQVRLVVQIAVLSACRSHQLAVVVLLDAAGSLGSLTLGEADDIAAQGPLGIGTDVGVFEPCAVDPLLHRLLPESVVHLLHPAFKLRLLVVGQVFRVADIAGIAAVRDDLPKVVLAVAEDLA